MPQVWNTWAILFQVMASGWILQKLSKSSIGLSQRTSKLFNIFFALPIFIVVSLTITPKKITALTSLLKKDSPFIFNEEALSQLQILKESFTTPPILSHFNPSLTTIVETNASDYAMGAVLSQVNASVKLPIAFDSRKLLPAELNYEIHDKELLGIVWALKRWRAFLLSVSNSFEVLTDHSSLQYFMSSKGRLATLPDALSCWDDVYPEREVDFISKNSQNSYQVIKQDGIQESRFFSIKVEIFSDLIDKTQKEVWKDKDYKEILKQLEIGESLTDYSLEPQDKLLLFKGRVVITSNEEIQLNILQKRHDSPLAGHPGQEKTLKLIKRDFHWTGMNQLTKDYVSSLVADRVSKMEILIPTDGTITALELAQIFISHVFSKHGLPQLKISRDLSAAFHPETDGQTERLNQILEQYLQMYFSYHQDDWNTWFPLAEFAYNNVEHYSTKQSLFFTIYGRNPSFDSIHIFQDSPAGKVSKKLQSVQQVFKEELESEIRRFKKYSDRNRSIPPEFQPGDKVRLASRNIKTTRLTKKLSERWPGPFEVLKSIGSHAYHLKFPQKWNSVHSVFHVSLLESVKQSSIPNCNQMPPPVLVEEQEECQVAQVLDSKFKRGKLWCLLEWKGFSEYPERTT
ncbi:hypothetical protein O181_057379 [Austropuccinia psidii MF-1]|uniref:Integrase catalytic domain-containing protein n=1 Tax=Austropuccinia psidii MF-1 TaxID=1389203 RepID=A0A9Q3EAC4_9BASI|nr:hypothetical protein [Austropuccinia psidii MF-1]